MAAIITNILSTQTESDISGHLRARLLLSRAQCKQHSKQLEPALEDLDTALSYDSSLLKAHVQKAQLLFNMGNFKAAQQSADAAQALVGPASDVELVLQLLELKQKASAARATPVAAPPAARHADPRFSSPQATQAAISEAIMMINGGRWREAVALMDAVLAASPEELGALLARGSARALLRDLPGAITDLSAAIEVEPRFADAWRRRGQARAAANDLPGALADLQQCQKLLPLLGSTPSELRLRQAELQAEMASLHHRLGDYRSAVAHLDASLQVITDNAQSWHLLGVCHAVMGHISEALAAYNATLALDPHNPDVWLNVARALKGAGAMEEAEVALLKATDLDERGRPRDLRSSQAMLLRAQLYFYQGLHATAVRYAQLAAEQQDEGASIEPLLFSATSHHTLGRYQEAIADYDECMRKQGDPNNRDQTVYQLLCWYQRVTALYAQAVLDRPAASFSIDCELPADLREAWCKKATPSPHMLAGFAPLRPQPSGPAAPVAWRDIQELTERADQLGALLQYTHQGFHANRRQQRAAGYAAIELAQAMRELMAARAAGGQVLLPDGGSSGHCSGAGQHAFGWRDAMDLVVKWRQLAEPGDAVLWVDTLPARSFEEGFGSHTRMLGGQGKDIRYHMNAGKALALHKALLAGRQHTGHDAADQPLVLSDADRAAIAAAQSAEELWQAIGEDSWAVVPLSSVYRANHSLEGTRLTLVRQHNGYEFSIRTPNTPQRWADFEAEMALAWEGVLRGCEGGSAQQVAHSVLAFGYFWYNLMPLARGTAGAGYTSILAMFLAAGMEVQARIPPDYQVDWEAILAPTYDQFKASVSAWLLPKLVQPAEISVEELPLVAQLLATPRQRIEALNFLEQGAAA